MKKIFRQLLVTGVFTGAILFGNFAAFAVSIEDDSSTVSTPVPQYTSSVLNSQSSPRKPNSNSGPNLAREPANFTVAEPLTGTAPIPGPYELYGLLMCSKSGFKCISLKPQDSWYQLFPDQKERDLVMRLNRTNVDLKYRHWLVVPENLKNMSLMDLTPLPLHLPTHGKKLLVIDLDLYAFGAYDKNGDLINWGPANGGADYCPEMHGPCRSAAGTFYIYKIQGPDCTSSEYPIATTGGAPMPWCMHYFRGYAVHASTLTGFANRSRGCIRLFYDDAKWLNQQFVTLGTRIIVKQKPLEKVSSHS